MRSLKPRILCTEDDTDTREMIVYLLTEAGYDVDCIDSPSAALELARNEFFDLFLVDNWMQGMKGPELTRALRAFNRTTPILFYSAAAYETDKRDARDAGAQGYLVKPEGVSILVAEVAKLIEEAKIAVPVAVDPPLI